MNKVQNQWSIFYRFINIAVYGHTKTVFLTELSDGNAAHDRFHEFSEYNGRKLVLLSIFLIFDNYSFKPRVILTIHSNQSRPRGVAEISTPSRSEKVLGDKTVLFPTLY